MLLCTWRAGAATLAFALCGLATAGAAERDLEGSADHPLVSRYEGSHITGYERQEFNRYGLAVGELPKRRAGTQQTRALEGTLTRLTYRLPEDRSSLEVFENYRREMSAGGFRELYNCAAAACGASYGWSNTTLGRGSRLAGKDRTQNYLAAHLPRPEGDVYLALYVVRRSAKQLVAQLDVLEQRPMQEGMVQVDAAYLMDELAENGRVALYSLYFDHDKDELKAESGPTLASIAEMLRRRPELKVHIVGHTDNTGSLAYNQDLSRRRADSVVQALVSRHGITSQRLAGHGIGPLAPVASNELEQGRKLNRRVELVQR